MALLIEIPDPELGPIVLVLLIVPADTPDPNRMASAPPIEPLFVSAPRTDPVTVTPGPAPTEMVALLIKEQVAQAWVTDAFALMVVLGQLAKALDG